MFGGRPATEVHAATPTDPLAAVLLRLIAANPLQGVSKTEMHAATGKRRTADELNAALADLRAGGQAVPREVPTGGRSAERWFPVVSTTTNPLPPPHQTEPPNLRSNEERPPAASAGDRLGGVRSNEERPAAKTADTLTADQLDTSFDRILREAGDALAAGRVDTSFDRGASTVKPQPATADRDTSFDRTSPGESDIAMPSTVSEQRDTSFDRSRETEPTTGEVGVVVVQASGEKDIGLVGEEFLLELGPPPPLL